MTLKISPITKSYIQSLAGTDPDLYNIFNAIFDDLSALNDIVNPPTIQNNRTGASDQVFPDNVASASYVLNLENVTISWTPVDTAVDYEVRVGASFDTGFLVTVTSALQITVNPLPVGNTNYFIKAINDQGNESVTALQLVVMVPSIPAPIASGYNIVNTAILQWTVPASAFRIDHYVINRNGVFLANFNGTFFPYQESAAGTNSYTIAAVDIAGNVSATATVSVTVSAPSDFVQQGLIISTFTGTLTNAYRDTSRGAPILEVCVDTAEQYGTHFSSRGYATPQDQINAGFPIYCEPAQATASYVEIFDFGSIFNNVLAGVTYNFNLIAGTVSIATKLSFSTDNITYTGAVSGPAAFATSVRYVKVELDFTGGNNDVLELYNLQCTLSVHQELDAGSGTANAGDVGGTVFTFNKTFKSIISATATVNSTNSNKAVVSSVSITQIKVEVFNDAGARQTDSIAWKVFGITP